MAVKIRKVSQLVDAMRTKNAHRNVTIKKWSWMTISISGEDADPSKLEYPDGYYFGANGRITNRGNTKGNIFQAYDVVML